MWKLLRVSRGKEGTKDLPVSFCELNPRVLLDVQGMPGEKGEKGDTGLPGPQVLSLYFYSVALSLELSREKGPSLLKPAVV